MSCVSETMDGVLLRPPWKQQPITVAGWGCSHNYQMGTGQYVAQATPKIVSPLERIGEDLVDLACGADHCAAVDAAGRLFTWGLSDHGRLGLQTARDAPVPCHVRALSDEHIVSVACGMYTSACISEGLSLFTWGAGSKGQLGHVDTNDEWIASRTGIRKRHIISGDETLTSLAAAAAEEAMKDAGVEAKDIDLVILATSSPVGLHNRRRIGRHRMN